MSDELPTTGITPPADTTPATPPAEKTFTQQQMEYELGQRIIRERAKYADYDQLKAAAQKLQELEESQLSEREKLEKQLRDYQQRITEAEAQAAEQKRLAQQTLIRSAVVSEAARLGFANPEDAYRLLDNPPSIGEDGKPAGVTEAVAALAQGRPYLLRTNNQSRIPAGEPFNPAGPTGQLRETDEQRRLRLRGGHRNVFDVAEAEKRGGGVVWGKKPE